MTSSYFKVPVDRLVARLPDKYGFTELNPSQRAMMEGLSTKRNWVHISARRTGKSSGAAVLALAKLLEPNQQVIVVAPDFNLSSIIWDFTTELIEAFNIETKRFNLKDRVVRLVNDSTLRLLSANNRSSLVGRAANLLIVDEAALIPDDEYFTRDLRPALSTFPDSRALFISTPRGKENYLYGYYLRGQDPSFPEWGSGLFPWHANPRLTQEDIEEAKRAIPDSLFRQEYYCEWATFEGQIYKLDENEHLRDLVSEGASYRIEPSNERFTFIGGLDMGYRDATAFVIVATDGANWYVVDEYVATEGTTSQHAEAIKAMSDYWNVENIYIDSAAQQTRADLAYDYDIACDNAIKSVNDGIAHIQTLVEQNKLFFDIETASYSFKSMTAYRWNSRTEKAKPNHDWTSHCCDAIRYAIYSYNKNSAVSIYS
jgi:hypothetical protein